MSILKLAAGLYALSFPLAILAVWWTNTWQAGIWATTSGLGWLMAMHDG